MLQLLFADQGLVNRKLVDDVLRYKRLDGAEAALRTVAGPCTRRAAANDVNRMVETFSGQSPEVG